MLDKFIEIFDVDGKSQEIPVDEKTWQFDKDDFWKEDWQERKAKQRNSYEQLCEIYERGELPDKLVVESCEDAYIKDYEKEILWKAINSLSEKQKRRLLMYFFDGLTFVQISKIENCSERSVKDAVYLALQNLKKFLEKFNG